jgi:hypothetical protein
MRVPGPQGEQSKHGEIQASANHRAQPGGSAFDGQLPASLGASIRLYSGPVTSFGDVTPDPGGRPSTYRGFKWCSAEATSHRELAGRTAGRLQRRVGLPQRG